MCAGFVEALGFPMKGPGWVGLSALLTALPPWEGGRAAAGGVMWWQERRSGALSWTSGLAPLWLSVQIFGIPLFDALFGLVIFSKSRGEQNRPS